jgi:hypothetical protein
MWFYREAKRAPGAAPATALPAAPSPSQTRRADLRPAARTILRSRPRDPDAWLLMALLVDCRFEMEDGTHAEKLSWLDAERLLAEANESAEPLRLYNRFSREFGDGYATKAGIPESHATALREILAALRAFPGVKSVTPRETPASSVGEVTPHAPDLAAR